VNVAERRSPEDHTAPHAKRGQARPKPWHVCRQCRCVLPFHDLACPGWFPVDQTVRVSGA
jgi:hypothetical protein